MRARCLKSIAPGNQFARVPLQPQNRITRSGHLCPPAPRWKSSSSLPSTFRQRPARISKCAQQASSASVLILLGAACAAAFAIDLACRRNWLAFAPTKPHPPPAPAPARENPDTPSWYLDMPSPAGHLGNLTAEQELKLQQFWAVTLKTFGVEDPNAPARVSADLTTPRTSLEVNSLTPDRKKGKKRMSIFRKHEDDKPAHQPGTESSGTTTPKHVDEDDKYGQAKDFQRILATQTPEKLRMAFWNMLKADHPDALLLRFLRARKWDVDRALVMLISTMNWRSAEMHVDDDVVIHGEARALADSQSEDSHLKKEGEDFLAQLRMGKSFLHGTDKDGRPLCFVRVRLHKQGEQTEASIERYTVYIIETARLALRSPIETACIVFDMTHFSMANMDYGPVKFMIKIFEANYPESLGAVLVHKSPWIFHGIWNIIKGWLDPVVAGKVHFTKNVEELEHYIPKSQIIKELGGDEDWEYKYVEPTADENAAHAQEGPKRKFEEERQADVGEFQKRTFEWIAAGTTGSEAAHAKQEREVLAEKLHSNYWQLDPYIRARTLYDRTGMIEPGGTINFYPERKRAGAEAVDGSSTSKPPPQNPISLPSPPMSADDLD